MSKKMILKILILLSLLIIISFALKGFLVHENFPPDRPVKPKGSSNIDVGWSADYSTYTTDPDGDEIKLGWDWDGDDIVDEWTEWYSPGLRHVKTKHQWTTYGIFHVKVRAKDINGAQSNWSEILEVTVNYDVIIPHTPNIYGPTCLEVGKVGTYFANTTTPDGQQVRYYFFWDDRAYNLTDYMNSGIVVNATHSWNTTGTYTLVVEAENEHLQRSHESILVISVIEGK